ncbi:MAG TPA: Gfo/Idh/MocA family oxidoreductase, partial [Victivallales bacterium]|nr:Gfo/Idh/MocA family oxidoreductase [Victivallales bacterium]
MDLLRVCIVGAGNLSSRKIYPLIGTAGAQLVGVCDIDKTKAEKNASLWGGKCYTDMEYMLDTEKPDAVIICISAQMHAKLAALAMRKGVPVYTEKPPAES